ncbi:MAG: riboflavin synthase, partial [Acidobacteriaceae bacterium]
VQGHVDATGKLVSILPLRSDLDTTDWRITLELPEQLTSQVISQGSITVDGISLTVAHVDLPRIEIAIIPHTYRSTNLRTLKPGSPVNLETDVLAKYAAGKRISEHQDWLTPAYLLANGY